MIESYDTFVEKARKENPDMFEILGEDYFKKFYETKVKVEADYKRIKEAFTATQLDQKIADLSNVGIDDTKALIDHAHLFVNTLTMMLSNDYDAIYACPEVAAFMKLSPYFHRPKEINPCGVYKFGQFVTETFMVDCYKAPNEVAERDCILLHKRSDEWLKLEVKISEYYERKYKAAQEISKKTLYFDENIGSKKFKSAIYEDCEARQIKEKK